MVSDVKIFHAVEWSAHKDRLLNEIRLLPYNYDLRRLLLNIDGMVVELSKAEVEARRTRDESFVNEKIDVINESIRRVEKLIVLLRLRS